MRTKEVSTLEELKTIGLSLAQGFKIPQLVLLEGPLAVGKTQMTRYMTSAIGCEKESVRSPAFSLINVYKRPDRACVYHVDLFRLESERELDTIGFWDIFYSPTAVFIEWPQLVMGQLPPFWNKLYIEMSFSKNKSSRSLRWKTE